MTNDSDHIILYDSAYTKRLNDKIAERYGPKDERRGLHATDLIFCLRKAWAKKRLPTDQLEVVSDDTILTWGEGLMFEDLVSTGEKQKQAAYCFRCRTTQRIVPSVHGDPEPARCPSCKELWVIFTPDYIDEGIIHEAKQTRKSRRKGPEEAPWWIDQLRTYLLFARRAGWTDSLVTRLVVNWLMGDYGSKKKGERPRPPQSALDSYMIVFLGGFESAWEGELQRRSKVVMGDDMPMLRGTGQEHGSEPLSPMYEWECASCPVGDAIGCEMMQQWDTSTLAKEETSDEPQVD